jgi:translation initiation factor 5A
MATAEDLKKGECIIINNGIYKITRKEVVAVGTHSHSKTKIYVVPIEGGGEKNYIYNHQDKVEIPEIENRVGQIISIGENSLQVMDTKTYETLEVLSNQEILDKAEEGKILFFFTYQGVSKALQYERGG